MKNVMFGLPKKFDNGKQTTICMNASDYFIEVHKSQNNDELWSNFGQMKTTNHIVTATVNDQDDLGMTGHYPMAGMNKDGLIVVVFQDSDPDDGDTSLKYVVGSKNSNENAEWGSKHSCNFNGLKPSVVVSSDGTKALLFFEMDNNNELYYAFGTINSDKTITWDTTKHNYGTGHAPRVSINDSGHLVETHYTSSAVYFSTATVDFSAKTVTWGVSSHAATQDSGSHNSQITINGDNLVILLYQLDKADPGDAHETGSHFWNALSDLYAQITSTDNIFEMKIRTGLFSGSGTSSTVTWQDAQFVGWGDSADIACGTNYSMISQYGAAKLNGENSIVNNDDELSFITSRVMDIGNYTDRANWMYNNFRYMALKDLMIPAAHDAGMYETHDCFIASNGSTQTQNKTFAQMLAAGVRYFDIRPSRSLNNTFYCYHRSTGMGCYGAPISNILSDVSTFLDSHKEVVILKFSHYDFPNHNDDKKDLESMVATALAGKLHPWGSSGSRLAELDIVQIVSGDHGIALPVFQRYDDGDDSADYNGLYTYADYEPSDNNTTAADLVVYDKYADDDSLEDMRQDQLDKMHNVHNHGGDLFLLSWTLTQQIFEGMSFHFDQLNSDIQDFAKLANNTLTQVLSDQEQQHQISRSTLPNLVYVDFCNNFVTDICTWLNYCRSNGHIS